MEAPRLLYGGSAASASNFDGVLLQNQRVMSPSSKEPIIGSVFVPGGSTSFLGSSSMFSFRSVSGDKKSERSFFDTTFDQEDNEAEDLDEYFHQPGKKRRLTVDQVQFLEKNFGEENKLEPERKVQLAKELGLQPRQIAIWFQNRRARWKTKQLEKDYDALRNRYDNLKSDYDNLVKEKENLRAQVLRLTDELLVKDKEKVELALCDINQKDSDALPKGTMSTTNPIWEDELSNASAMALKQLHQEDLSSAKSDVFDSESPRYADGVHSSFLDQVDSSYVFEAAQSDISQDDDEKFSKNLLPIGNFIDQAEHDRYPVTSSNYFRFPVEDHSFGFWSC